ncbi:MULTISPECIES: ParH-like protein [unclassified Streptomyces]|uniref:ParH-like protein n=1 Tax=unclassified Streptomyces TaxID=2593676 RepID=UPI0022B5E99E|nr:MULTISPECIES: ParH-like protein [unclassified Streptomyces]MCZ7416139.1 ParH-like protein [Streptomyces sp. WMMC897]MCZ7434053.1 ParH-like protein [Streptomyces sp. WMMC1477]
MRVVRQHRRLWRRAGRIADSLPLPSPFDATAFIASVAERRGRPIEILPVPLPHTGPCGLLATTSGTDYILCTRDTTALHREHILLHEAAHLLFGHDRQTDADAGTLGVLIPHLPPTLVRQVLGRTCYGEPHEQEAEVLASLLRYRALRNDAVSPPPGQGRSRAAALIGEPVRRPDGN